MELLAVGSIALDTVETINGKVNEVLGGSASYFSLAAQNFTQVNLVAVTGLDFPPEYELLFKEHHIDLKGVTKAAGRTFRWSGKYGSNPNDRETIFTELNVFADFNPVIPAEYKENKVIFLGNINPGLQLSVLNQVMNPEFTSLDTMNFWIINQPELLKKVLKRIELLMINDSEVKLLSGLANLYHGARKIIEMGPRFLVVKKGEHGALLISRDKIFAVPSYPLVQVIDPTGAGDSFAGGFMGYLAHAEDFSFESLKKGMFYGSITASFSIESFSVEKLTKIKNQDINRRFKEFLELSQIQTS